ncbi:NIMA-like protein kinase [Zalerion maritima]|uniref:non-specific serine/threonine protein kinase n=1 Tax=Zalerion maritima TaxID=339359 RepID=A0AAD5RHW3_9PEZI|nr:NIMA-like protein kinase [Zalerion maritima]
MESKITAPEVDKYDILEKIGHGSFGIIRKVRRKNDNLVMCRKEISYLRMSQKEREQLHAEFQILSTLKHPNIVAYYHREHLKSTQDLHLYMEYCGNGDLGRTIRQLQVKNQYADETFVWTVFSQLVSALYRCHYGVDPPDVGKFTLGLGANAKPKTPTGGVTILHRDLKPENIFLGEGNSVKLGDFGLSKMIQSHDFASTYVGTPFYMSPEICAAEKYTLKSDIWSLGCIIYELCTKDPPFNAKSHFQLVQKIKEGKVSPLPNVYSPELGNVIRDCLKVNPDRRPDTASLLNLPIVRLMRKETEVVKISRTLREKEELLNKRMKEMEQRMAAMEAEKAEARQEIDSSLRREWEVKARLEIDRHVQIEIEALQKRFESEVQVRVESEMSKKTVTFAEPPPLSRNEERRTDYRADYQGSSVGTYGEEDISTTTDLTDISLMESPEVKKPSQPARTPFGRAQTFAAPNGAAPGTPMDVEMVSPSPAGPISISSLSLSPRRRAAAAAVQKARSANAATIFSQASNPAWAAPRDPASFDSDSEFEGDIGGRTASAGSNRPASDDGDEEDEFFIPSPTRNILKSKRNPFLPRQPGFNRTKTAPAVSVNKALPSIPISTKNGMKSAPTLAPPADMRPPLRERSTSPNRRLSKIPSAANLNTTDNGPTLNRKPSFKKEGGLGDFGKAIAKGAIVRGRTLVELQQARAGGRAVENINVSPQRKNIPFRDRCLASEPAAVWDPKRDDMPSPFLARTRT